MYSVIQRSQDVDTLVCIYITSILVAVFEIVCASSCTVFIFSLFCYTNEFEKNYTIGKYLCTYSKFCMKTNLKLFKNIHWFDLYKKTPQNNFSWKYLFKQ